MASAEESHDVTRRTGEPFAMHGNFDDPSGGGGGEGQKRKGQKFLTMGISGRGNGGNWSEQTKEKGNVANVLTFLVR